MGKCAMGQSCAAPRKHARRLNLLAHGDLNAAGCEFAPGTVLRGDAQAEYSMRFRPAYGPHRSTA